MFLNIHTSLTAIFNYIKSIPNMVVSLINFGAIVYDLIEKVTGGLYTNDPGDFMYDGRYPLFLYPDIRRLERYIDFLQPGL